MTNLSGFDLNLLRVLDALLQEHSTVRAGKRLGLSQPAVSAALGRLRTTLGDELFFRRGQGLEATRYALSLEVPLREALDRIERLIQGPSGFDPTKSQAGFRISGSDFFAELLMPKLAEYLQVEAPMMRVHLVDLVPDSYIDTLDRYEVDLALIPKMEVSRLGRKPAGFPLKVRGHRTQGSSAPPPRWSLGRGYLTYRSFLRSRARAVLSRRQ